MTRQICKHGDGQAKGPRREHEEVNEEKIKINDGMIMN